MNRTDQLNDLADLKNLVTLRFDTPWSARLFGVTLTLAKRGLFSLQDFQRALIDRIALHENGGCIENDEQYYTCWLEALESLLRERSLLSESDLVKRQEELVHAAHHIRDEQHGHGHAASPLRIDR